MTTKDQLILKVWDRLPTLIHGTKHKYTYLDTDEMQSIASVTICEAANTYTPICGSNMSFYTYACICIKRAWIDANKSAHPTAQLDEHTTATTSSTAIPEIYPYLTLLPIQAQLLLWCRYINSLTIKQTSEILHLSRKTVIHATVTALSDLRRILEAQNITLDSNK